MNLYKIHPSSIGKIMSVPKSKTEVLSVGAKTYLKGIARELAYGFRGELDNKFLRKGIQCEDDSIELLNQVYFKSYKKHSGRIETDLLSGECDILTPDYIRDVKTSWSLETFPVLIEDAEDTLYEWQGRAYMWLWEVPEFEINYCMVNTPDDLIGYEDSDLHYVDHIAPELLVTRVCYHRDTALEAKMATKAEAAQKYIETLIQQIAAEHNY